jgi:RNA polymerase sigma-70 factor (ECF subfamily)
MSREGRANPDAAPAGRGEDSIEHHRPDGTEAAAAFRADLARARDGDRGALDRLLARVQENLSRRAAERTGTQLKARVRHSDIVQNTWLEILRGLQGFQGETEEAFTAWVQSVMENAIRHQRRWFDARKRKSPERTSEARRLARKVLPAAPTPSTDAMRAEDLALVGRALDALTEDYRKVILLCVIEDRPHKEVAEILGRTEAATRMLLNRARSALSLEIERLEGGGPGAPP